MTGPRYFAGVLHIPGQREAQLRSLLLQAADLAAAWPHASVGSNRAARIAMIAMTTGISMRVKPDRKQLGLAVRAFATLLTLTNQLNPPSEATRESEFWGRLETINGWPFLQMGETSTFAAWRKFSVRILDAIRSQRLPLRQPSSTVAAHEPT